MKNSLNKLAFLSLLLFVGMAGCKKQLDINENPNQATETNVTAELILPNALHGVGVQTALGYGWLSNWMGYWSASGSFNPSTEESSYNITNTFQETKWAGIYNVLFDLHQVEQKALANNQPFYRAIALVMKAHLFQNLVDIYGNVPYSQAFRPSEFPTPAFDKAEDIYADLQVRLDTAIGIMKTAPVTTAAKGVDIVFNGEKNLWIKLANTIKLRLLIRQTEVNPNPTAEIAKIKAEGGVLQSGESADVNPGYQNDVGKQSPFFGAYGLLPSGQEANTFFRANAFIIDILKATEDPRLEYYFAPASSPANANDPYVGTVYGSPPDAAFSGDRTSNIGPGLAKAFNQPQWILTSVESMFLQAEAVYRGWDIGGPYVGNPEEAYNAAVTESFVWLGVENAEAAAETYLTEIVPYDGTLELIIIEKYLSLVGINPLEAWNDYRRVGIELDIPLSVIPARGNRQVPVRLLYPQAELAVNQSNVLAQGTIDPQASKLFWDK
jgi:hypothetical protein